MKQILFLVLQTITTGFRNQFTKFHISSEKIVENGIHVFVNEKDAEDFAHYENVHWDFFDKIGTMVVLPVECYHEDLIGVGTYLFDKIADDLLSKYDSEAYSRVFVEELSCA